MGRECHLAPTLQAAFDTASRLPNALLAGELGGDMPAGFELTNSPAQLAARSDVSRPLVLLSSTGTRLMHRDQTQRLCVSCLLSQLQRDDCPSGEKPRCGHPHRRWNARRLSRRGSDVLRLDRGRPDSNPASHRRMTRPCAWPADGALHLATHFSRVKAWPTCRGAASFAISTSFSATLTMSIPPARSVRTETRRLLWQSEV